MIIMLRKTRILYIIDEVTGNIGGTEKQLIELINGLNRDKFEIVLTCFRKSHWFEANSSIFECETKIIRINNFRNLLSYLNILKLIRFIRDYKPDIVHTFFPVGNILGVLSSRMAGTKNIISSRRDYGEWMNGRYLFATRLANRFVKRVITNSDRVKELTERKEGISGERVDVIYNGINLVAFNKTEVNRELRRILGIPDNHKIVGIVANFRPMKHHYTFINAANEILAAREDISFILIGTGFGVQSTKEANEKLVKSFGIENNVHFIGPQDEVISYLSIMDIGVNCSACEGLSNAVMEYMATGVPCIVSRSGGNPDLITNNVHGYTFELDDSIALARLILQLLGDDTIRRRFVENARKKIEEEMSMERMVSKYEDLYMRLAGYEGR